MPPPGAGIVTTRRRGLPLFLWKLATPAPLSAMANGATGEEMTRPQGLTRFLSVNRAIPGISETRLVCSKSVDGSERSSSDSTAGRQGGRGRLGAGRRNTRRRS